MKRGDRFVAAPYDPLLGDKRWLGTFKTKKAAVQRVAEWRVERSSPERMSLSKFTETWLEQMHGRVSDRTLMDYTTTANQCVSLIGDIPIAAITPRVVEDMVKASVRKPYAGNTTHKQLTRLRQMLSTAVRWGWLPKNPADGRIPLPRRQKRQVVPLSPDEAERLIEAADDYYKPVFLLVLTSGLRWEEVFGLRWDDINGSMLSVRQALWERKLGKLKSEAAYREIVLPPQTVEALNAHREVCPTTDLDLVFPTPWGKPMATKTWSESVMIPTAKRAKLPDIRLHDLRHVYASLLIKEGHMPKLVQALMGHSTITVTYDTYGHLFPDEKHQAAVSVGNYFGSKTVATEAAAEGKPR